MSKKRYVNTSFWRDDYVSNLDPSEKLLFLYFLTNPDTNISGIYQIPVNIIVADTGFNREMVWKIIERFAKDGKIKYQHGWIAIKNFIKNQNEKSPQVIKGIENEITKAPKVLREWVQNKETEGIDTLSHLDLDSDLNLDSDFIPAEIATPTNIAFGTFWVLYDKKVDRTKCEKLWKKVNPDAYDLIFTHVQDYVKATPDKQFRKNPETYLRNQAWTNEVIVRGDTPAKPTLEDTTKKWERICNEVQ